jgi:hypothetical protein
VWVANSEYCQFQKSKMVALFKLCALTVQLPLAPFLAPLRSGSVAAKRVYPHGGWQIQGGDSPPFSTPRFFLTLASKNEKNAIFFTDLQ